MIDELSRTEIKEAVMRLREATSANNEFSKTQKNEKKEMETQKVFGSRKNSKTNGKRVASSLDRRDTN